MIARRKAVLPLGFKASGVASGIKKSGRLDLVLIASDIPAKASCRFTTNKVQAAPLKVCQRHLKANKYFYAIIANSGNANCFTGQKGIKDADDTVKAVARVMGVKKETVFVASTGIIGRSLPMEKIKKAIPGLAAGLSRDGINKAKKAIMTTDKIAKEITVRFNIGSKTITICGIAKGAGMIAPNMACPERSRGATMLCFILTDAYITQTALDKALKIAVDNSFNCITVDGCMSTNDSVIILANGASKNTPIKEGRGFHAFQDGLSLACLELAKLIIRDAEGATKFIQIKVGQAKSIEEARKVALSIANSNLFKTAVYGENPNFGRIVSAVGASGVDVKEEDIKVKVSPLRRREINVDVSIGRGDAQATIYTSDLTPEYIKINAEYN